MLTTSISISGRRHPSQRSRPASADRRSPGRARAVCPVLSVAGCSAAPSQDILGSFFPSWLLCAAIGVAAAAASHRLLAAAGLGQHLLVPPLVYLAIAVAVTLLVWLTWFGG